MKKSIIHKTGLILLILISLLQADNTLVLSRFEFLFSRMERLDHIIENSLAEPDRTVAGSRLTTLKTNLSAFHAQFLSSPRTVSDILLATNRLNETHASIKNLEETLYRKGMQLRNVEKALQRTDRALLRAARILRTRGLTDNDYPEIRRAFEIQDGARAEFDRREPLRALNETLRARALLLSLASEVLDENDRDDLQDREKQYWEATNAMLDRARGHADPVLLENVSRLQERAAKAFKENNLKAALQFARSARRLAEQLTGKDAQNQSGTDIERALRKLEQARGKISSDNHKAMSILDAAQNRLEQAQSALSNGRNREAAELARVALKLIGKAADMSAKTGGDTEDRTTDVLTELSRTRRLIERAATTVQTGTGRTLVSDAQRLLGKAEDAIKADDLRTAGACLDQATDKALAALEQNKTRQGQE